MGTGVGGWQLAVGGGKTARPLPTANRQLPTASIHLKGTDSTTASFNFTGSVIVPSSAKRSHWALALK
jgi:hypothetical protein